MYIESIVDIDLFMYQGPIMGFQNICCFLYGVHLSNNNQNGEIKSCVDCVGYGFYLHTNI